MSIRKSHLSKEEIIKQFDLPERKSKIATLLKQDEQAYCICRSSDSSRFMIGCDACEEWYHGDCINITESEAKHIKQFFCIRCREEDPSLITRYKVQKTEAEKLEYQKKREKDKLKKKEKKLTSRRCGECVNCLRKSDCGKCNGCTNIYKQKCLFRICANRERNKANENKDSKFKRQKTKLKQKEFITKSKRGRKRKDSESSNDMTVIDTPRQCYGPMCTKPSRPGSKYCSDTCGLKLATNRIYQVLPQRIQEWSLCHCIAEENNKKALETVRKQQLEVRRILHELDKRHLELDAVIARGKQCKVEESEDKLEDEESEIETSMYCITCGHEIHSRTAIRHMDKCFNKYESQASFGSIYKTRIQGNNMFCDFYNAANKTYCKRLKVLCPEHGKEPKAAPTEVCGCPLVTNVFDLTGEYCRASKRNCVKHYAWEKLRRAEIDMERVRQWLKIDELVEKERQLRYELATRAGVLALMLHSTYNHDLMEQLAAAQHQKKHSKSG
ncbi:cpg binding protein, putative [Pediculus humanus corporis]|uniref:CXXC-type zinc finger protein 1 n=1 Tax=Pediculus humanus subsp. corporis TaxID=121224 RepID=E0W3Q2_PEDHC|nr:cpg binding protein, putative [Pediculus humanus corporis]EEB20258.1 cpg binding protein, putative [Pediculus humanus corporis]